MYAQRSESPKFRATERRLIVAVFRQYRSLGRMIVMAHGGAPSAYNRKIELQLRFTF